MTSRVKTETNVTQYMVARRWHIDFIYGSPLCCATLNQMRVRLSLHTHPTRSGHKRHPSYPPCFSVRNTADHHAPCARSSQHNVLVTSPNLPPKYCANTEVEQNQPAVLGGGSATFKSKCLLRSWNQRAEAKTPHVSKTPTSDATFHKATQWSPPADATTPSDNQARPSTPSLFAKV